MASAAALGEGKRIQRAGRAEAGQGCNPLPAENESLQPHPENSRRQTQTPRAPLDRVPVTVHRSGHWLGARAEHRFGTLGPTRLQGVGVTQQPHEGRRVNWIPGASSGGAVESHPRERATTTKAIKIANND